jgi:hypothetical protein
MVIDAFFTIGEPMPIDDTIDVNKRLHRRPTRRLYRVNLEVSNPKPFPYL